MLIRKIRDVKTPERGTRGSAGIDFFVPKNMQFMVAPQSSVSIPSGIRVHIPKDIALVAMNKSGIARKRNLVVGACVIDSDYQGELHLHVMNVGRDSILIEEGTKLVQMLMLKINTSDVVEIDKDEYNAWFDGDIETERGDGGFGSTGEK